MDNTSYNKYSNEKKIYLLYVCDEYKSRDSMRLVCASTLPGGLKKAIEEMLRAENMEFTSGGRGLRPHQQITKFREAWEDHSRVELNDMLHYGYIEVVDDGEIL